MTKKDYIIIASAIRSQGYALGMNNRHSVAALLELSLVLAGKMAEDNPRFDRHKFLIACGYGQLK